jgi:hypothetical protein
MEVELAAMHVAGAAPWDCKMPWDIKALLRGLAGRWMFDRSIEGYGTMTGNAVFTPIAEQRLRYREDGTLRLNNGTEFAAEREYIYAPRENGFAVLFRENPPRLFHEVALVPGSDGELRGEADHPCGEDLYRSFYRFLPGGRFIVRHAVIGPRKDYAIVTVFAPEGR